jgi:5-(carboxyamino)imidazole ribonucleotide synthase
MSEPGPVLGILGGGQLCRMLALAAAKIGIKTEFLSDDAHSPAADVAEFHHARYDDEAALARFAARVDVVTYEFENVPARTAQFLAALKPVRPGPRALAVCQDRWEEKSFLRDLGIGTAPFANVERAADLDASAAATGFPAVLKTRRMGYDGKGQRIVRTRSDLDAAWQALKSAPCILEGFVEFTRELSVVAARGLDGRVEAYDPVENRHEDHILKTTIAPAAMTPERANDAAGLAGRILAALDYVGVIGVELFDTPAGLLVNELAPRVHNSGHWTIDACTVSQFEQHVRAVLGWPLGPSGRHSDAVMINLLGDEALGWQGRALTSGQSLHLYGKADARPGRKMGHLTTLSPKSGG